MSEWPTGLTVAPIREWPGTLRSDAERVRSPFASTLTSTMTMLHREIYNLVDTAQQQDSAELLVAIDPSKFRLDGKPYAAAVAQHPGVIFSLDTRHGHLSYPCDRFPTWQDNLRAIALALEALRKVDRYGVTAHGEQYRGFLALPAGAGPNGVEHAVNVIATHAGIPPSVVHEKPGWSIRAAKRSAHPDTGGSAESWHDVQAAEQVLLTEGILP
jgi:hypothetical protein